MNIKMATSSQLSTTESKKQTKQTIKTGTESQIWRSFGELRVGRGKGENEGKGAGIKKYKLVLQNRQGSVIKQFRKWRSERIYMHDPWT